jgi:hypothetical protein
MNKNGLHFCSDFFDPAETLAGTAFQLNEKMKGMQCE